jgi:hypothetical protein
MKRIAWVIPVAAFMPTVAFAAAGDFGALADFIQNIVQFINDVLVPLVFAIAFLVFIWGVFQYFILGGGDETKREEGRQHMLWGIIGFVLMVSVWGIVNLLSQGLGLDDQEIQNIPNVRLENN